MENKVILVCDKEGCPDKIVAKAAELHKTENFVRLYLLQVIEHPPMQWCEHGGADSEKDERARDNANLSRRLEWAVHENELHGEALKESVEKLKEEGIEEVRIKIIQEEISFSSTLMNDLNEEGCRMVIMSEKTWDAIDGRKLDKAVKVVTA